jgi:sugar phosphate isomerase/epimerase
MQLSGFTDEAGKDLETQIKATKELGWSHLSARSMNGTNIHELPEDEFEQVADRLDEEGIKVVEFGSLIGNWAKSIASDFDITLAEIDRAIPRMHRLKTKFIRIMSYAMEPWGEDQQEAERIRRVREITKRFSDAGLQAIHENCQNYGGFSAEHTLRLVDEVPGLKLVFDTGNPVFTRDRSKPEPHPWQDALEFYQAVKEHVVHVHIKDCLNPPEGSTEPAKYTMPGEGQARLLETIRQMKADGYTGGFAIEPHVATVFHVQDGQEPDWQQCYDSFVAYGRAFEEMLSQLDG